MNVWAFRLSEDIYLELIKTSLQRIRFGFVLCRFPTNRSLNKHHFSLINLLVEAFGYVEVEIDVIKSKKYM